MWASSNLLKRTAIVLAALCISISVSGAASRPTSAATMRDETVDRVAIEQLTVEYSFLLDHGRANELAELFTEDGIFDNPNLGVRAVGREAIAAYYAQRAAEARTTRHITTNLRLEFETTDRATGTRIILYYRGDGPGPTFPAKPGSVGEYIEVFKRGADGKWRFASRISKLIFTSGVSQPK